MCVAATMERLLRHADFDAAFRRDGRPSFLACSTDEYKLSFVLAGDNDLHASTTGFTDKLRGYLEKRRLLIIGSTQGGWALPVPRRILEKFVVIVLGNCAKESRYGYREEAYISGVTATWESPNTAEGIVRVLMGVIDELFDLGLQREVSLIGASAGVDQIMTVAAALHGSFAPPDVRVPFIAPIAGAFHPTVFPLAAKAFLHHGTHVLVHSHKRDTHCPWEKVKDFWAKLQEDMRAARRGGVYIHLMTLDDRSLIDCNFHNITQFLCAHAEFWDEVAAVHAPNAGAEYCARCVEKQYGEAHRTVSAFVDYEPGYDEGMLDNCYSLQTALVVHYAFSRAAALNTENLMTNLCLDIAEGARCCFAAGSEPLRVLEEFRACFPEVSDAGGWSNRIPGSLVAESFMGLIAGKTGGILKAGRFHDRYVDIEVSQQFGALLLLHLTLPSNRNTDRWMNFEWTEQNELMQHRSLRGEDFTVPRKCSRPRRAPAIITNKRKLVLIEKLFESSEWRRLNEDDRKEISRGVQENDVISLILVSSTGNSVAHLIGTVQFAKPYKPKRQEAQYEYVSDLFLWVHEDCYTEVPSLARSDRLRVGKVIVYKTCNALKPTGLWGFAARRATSVFRTLRSDADLRIGGQGQSSWTAKRSIGCQYKETFLKDPILAPALVAALEEEVAVVMGPPGTGKSTQACCVGKCMIEGKSSHRRNLRLGWFTWTNAANVNQLHAALKAGIDPKTCIYVAEELPPGIDNVKCLSLSPKNYVEWGRILKSEPILNVFCGIGKTMKPLNGYSSVLKLWVKLFDIAFLDEAGQILEGFGLHLAAYARQILLLGDTAQLPAFTFLPDEHRTLMRAATTTVNPVSLIKQYRQINGLSTFCSCLSYAGRVQDGEEKEADTLQILVVLWDCPTTDADLPKSPAPTSAALVTELWQQGSYSSEGYKGKIITPYAKQRTLINRLLRINNACAVLDGIQGMEYDDIIGDMGRNHGTGFLRDPRRVNVLVTRARNSLILLLNRSLGRTAREGTGHDYFHHIRSVCEDLKIIWKVDARISASDTARAILRHMKTTQPLSRKRVREAFAPHLSFFSGYMEKVSGKLDKATAIPDSDDERDMREPIGEVILEIFQNDAMPQNDAIAPPAAIIEDDGNDKERDEGGNSDLPVAVLQSLVRRSETAVRLCSTFLHCHISGVQKLLLAALHGKDALRNATTGPRGDKCAQHYQCWKLCLETFAWILHWRVRAQYGQTPDREIGEFTFPYAGRETKYTLDALASGMPACFSFLKSLWGGSSQYDGSAYFYRYGNRNRHQTPWAYVESSVWTLILPKAVVAALTCTALKHEERAATKYWICIDLWHEGKWDYYHTVVDEEEAAKGKKGKAKQKGKRKREEGGNCLHLTPYSADKYTT